MVTLHPTAVAAYLQSIETLSRTIAEGEEHGGESKEELRALVDRITVEPAEAGSRPALTIEGHLTSLIGGRHFPTTTIVGGADGSGRATQTIPPIRTEQVRFRIACGG